jgi:hypothetical protein
MNFLKNLPGGRAGEANRSDPQSGVSRLIPVNVPAPVPVREIPASRVSFLGLICAGNARARNTGLPHRTDETEVTDRRVGHEHGHV